MPSHTLAVGPGIYYENGSTTGKTAPTQGGRPDGYGRMSGLLAEYGMVGMDAWLIAQLESGASDDTIMLELERTPQFQARFGARKKALEFNRNNPNAMIRVPTPAEILEFEDQVRGVFRRAGFPAGFYDTTDEIQQFMVDGRSVLEIAEIVEEGFLRVTQAPQEVQDAFYDFFGAQGPAALAAYFLDPELALPALERQVRQAEIAGTGRRFGIDVNKERADRLADVGVDRENAEQGFERVNQMGSLYGRTVAETAEDELTAEGAGIDFAFGLDNGMAKNRIISRYERRQADFAGVGGAVESKDGLAGLGSAD